MSAFYVMRYVGQSGSGGGGLYIGKDIVVGVDVLGGTYDGTYSQVGGRLQGTVTMTAPPGGAQLVTGQTLSGGQSVPLQFDLPSNFANGQPQPMTGVGGGPVQVTFQKLKDIP